MKSYAYGILNSVSLLFSLRKQFRNVQERESHETQPQIR